MLALALPPIVNTLLVTLIALAAAGVVFYSLFKSNRLFGWALAAALGAHLLTGGILYGIGKMESPEDKEVRVKIAAFRPPPQVKIPEPPKPKLPDKLPDLPFGDPSGKRDVKVPPKGNPNAQKAGQPGKKVAGDAGRPMTSGPVQDVGDIPVDVKDEGLFTGTFTDVINAADIRSLTSGGSGGGGGDGFGAEDGEGDGAMPRGFRDGKRGGRVYFVRLKHGSGAWNAHAEGTRRLLGFLNQYFPCETDSWPMTANEMRDRYMKKGAQPTFLYIYADETFAFSASEVTVLRQYMDQGGFLFVDSRPDPFIKDLVASELTKILPGSRLSAITSGHAINRFLFRLSSPGVGENVIDRKNYGIAQGSRLIVFYTMGNFTHLYASFTAGSDEYIKAQYQMGANVMLYGIRKGNQADVVQQTGAKADVTNQAIDRLLSLGGGMGPKPTADPNTPPASIKIRKDPPPTTPGGGDNGTGAPPPTAPGEEMPEDINLTDDW